MKRTTFSAYFHVLFYMMFVCLPVMQARAQLFIDQFNYTSTGTLAGDSLIRVSSPTPGTPTTGIWKGHSGYSGGLPTNPQMQTAASLTYSTAPTIGGSVSFTNTGLDVNGTFAAQNTGSVYASAIVSISAAQATGDYFFHLGQTSTTQSWNVTSFTARVFARSSGTGFQLGFTRATTAPTYGTTIYPFNTPIFIVVKHTFVTGTNNDAVSMYVFAGSTNPPSVEGTPDFNITTETGTDPTEISKIVIRQGTAANAPTGLIDYIRVGTTWGEVAPFPNLAATTLADFGSVNNGALSATQTYTLTGTAIPTTTNVTITAPANFQVSKDGTSFSNSVIYTGTELATPQTVSVRFAPTSGTNGVKSGNITHSGFSTTVAVTGTETGNAASTLVANPTTLADFGSVNNGANSTSATYTLNGTGVTQDVTVTAPANFQVSNNGINFSASVVCTATALNAGQTIHVRFSPTSGINGAKSGNITHSIYTSTTVAVSGTEIGNAPVLTSNPSVIADFGNVMNGANSTVNSYTLSAANLTADITVTAPTFFQVSKDGTNFSSSVVYTIAELATAQTVSVRFSPNSGTNGAKTGNITHSGSSMVVAVSGTEGGNPTLDAFGYGTNNADLVGNGGWSFIGTNTTPYVQYNPIGSLSFAPYPTLQGKASFSNNGQDVGKQFDAVGVNAGSAYLSALVRINSAQTAGDYFFAFNTSATGSTYYGRLFARSSGAGYQLGFTKFNTPSTLTDSEYNTTQVLTFGKVYLVVLKYTFNTTSTSDDIANVFVFEEGTAIPSTEPATPFLTHALGTDLTSTQAFRGATIRQGSVATAPSGEVDYIRFGSTWLGVTNVINPSEFTLNTTDVALADFGSTNNGASSTTKTYTLKTTNIASDVTVTAPANFQVSKDGITFSSSISYTATELATPKTVTVRFFPTSGTNGLKIGIITHTGFGGTTVEVRGTETGNLSTLVANPTSLTFGSVNNGANSTAQTYTLTANNLIGDVIVTAPAHFQVSKDGTTFSGNITYTVAELATPKTVSVRFSPTSGTNGTKTGNVEHSGFANTNVSVSGTETGNVATPTLVANPTTLPDFGSVNNGANSTAQTYTLTGSDLANDVTVTAPAHFQVSKDGTTFSGNITYTVAELATPKTVSVRFSPTSGTNGTKTGNVEHSGFANTNVAVSGTETGNLPTLVANPTSLTFGSVNNGANSTAQTYTLTGANLANDVTVTAPAHFQVSKDGTTFSGNITYTVAELATPKTVSVRFSPTSGTNGTKTGNVEHSGFANTNVAVSGTETGNSPTLVANPTSLTFGSVNNGANSTAQTYTLTGSNLANDVAVTAPAHFQVSKDGTTFSGNITYTVAELATPKTVSVRFSPTSGTNGTKTGNITHSDFVNTNVAVTGTETGNAITPTLVATPTSLSFGTVNNGATSTTQTYNLKGSFLATNVTITAPTNFEVSLNGTDFATTQICPFADLNTTAGKDITVRFKPISGINGVKSGNIIHSGFVNTNVAVSGTEAGNSTSLVVNPTSLTSFGNVTEGDVSAIKTYTLTVNNPSADFTISAPTHFQVSKDGINFASSVNVLLAEQANPLTISVRFVPVLNTSDGFKSGNITHTGFTNTVGVSGNKVFTQVVLIQSITSFGNVNTGSNSSSQSYTMIVNSPSASGVTVTAPAHFQVSKDNITFAQSITYTPAELTSSVFPKIRFSPTSGINGLRFGKVTHSFTTVGPNVQGTETGNAVSSTLTANPTTLNNFGSVNNGEVSAVQTYTLTASNLVYNVTVSVANINNFQVSKDGTTFASSINYTIAELATPQTVSVRFRPTSGTNGAKTDFIAHSGFTSTNVNVAGTETGNAPTLNTSTSVMNSFGDVTNGATSATQTYTLTATNLTSPVTVAIPAPFEVSKDGTTFSNSIEYTVAELTTSKTVRVRFKPATGINGTKFGTITHSGFPNINVSVSGTEIGNLSTLTATPTSLTFGTLNNGANSTAQTYTLTGTNLTADVTVTAPTNFQVSKDGITFSGNITYTVAELATSKNVSVRFSPTSGTNGTKTGNITHSGFANTNVAVSGTENNTPIIQTSVANITFSTPVGTNQASAVQIYTLSVNTTALFTTGITVSAPTHFEISKDGTTFSNTLSYSLAEIANTQTVRVRFKPTGVSDGVRTGNISHTSTGVTAVNVSVTGTESLALSLEQWANDFNISPNPAENDLQISCDAPARWRGANITFTDLVGKELHKFVWDNPIQKLILPISTWQRGFYLVRISVGKQSVVRKIILR
jgi:hypothetical protein